VTEGQGLTYPIIVRNAGNRTATGVVARASLPDEVSFVRAERGDFAVCNRAGREVTCTGGTIPAGSAGIFRIVITVPALGGNDSLLFSVEVDPNDAIRERNETNNTAFVLTEVGARPDLTVTATSTPWFMAAPFGAIRLPTHGTTVRVTVRNTGSSASPATTVRFNLRSPLADADIKCASGMGTVDGSCVEFPPAGCNQSGVVVTCTVGSLAPGASATLLASAFHDYIGFGYDFNTTVMVDPSNQVAERDEDNNTVTLNVRVG
jgi:uncharacterized repeat protein (TIGR01451 family)